jgi:flagellar biosynthesis/type III secretory pathway protein FliH
MTGLIKATDRTSIAERVRPISARADTRSRDPELPSEDLILRQEADRLAHALQASHEEVERLRGDISKAYRDGEAEGRKNGIAESDLRRSAYLSRLERGIDKATGQLASELKALEMLSTALAREALAKVLDNAGDHQELMAAAIRRQLVTIESHSVVCVSVSSDDFGDANELTSLKSKIGRRDLDLRTSDDLQAGECRIQLLLGGLEVGVGQQWARLEETLRGLAQSAESQ